MTAQRLEAHAMRQTFHSHCCRQDDRRNMKPLTSLWMAAALLLASQHAPVSVPAECEWAVWRRMHREYWCDQRGAGCASRDCKGRGSW